MAFSSEEFVKVQRRMAGFMQGLNYVSWLSHHYYPEVTDMSAALEKMKHEYQFFQDRPYAEAEKPIDLQPVTREELWKEISYGILYDIDGSEGHIKPEPDENGPHHHQYVRYQQVVNDFIDADEDTEIYLNKGGWVYADMPMAWYFEAVIISKDQGMLVLDGEAGD